MNKRERRWICCRCTLSFLYRLFKCRQFNRLYRMCNDSNRRARGTCPDVYMIEVPCSVRSVGYCNLKHGTKNTEVQDEVSTEVPGGNL